MTLVVAILLAIFVLPAPWGIVAVAAALVIEVGESLFLLRWSRRRRAAVGVEALVGARAVVDRDGFVRVKGELWRARGLGDATPGESVRVLAVDGLELVVER